MDNQSSTTDALQTHERYVVGIGASAGGLEALQKLLSALPPNSGFPYVIVQHLSPDYKSLLGEILSKYTGMPVIQAEDGMEVLPNCVYVIQPGKNMRISKGKLLLSSQKEKELNLPIDIFFRSLAEEAGPRAIAIILSGTGSDGTNGIKAIKENDGMILVQNPESSKFDGMPRSALRTGLVDAQITPEEIALELQHIASKTEKEDRSSLTEKQVDDDLMKRIYLILKKGTNVNFAHYKQTTILRRIERRMMLTHKDTLTDYVDYLYATPEEVKTLSKEALIGVTSFFRDPEYFDCLKEQAIQSIVLHSKEDELIRVWVAGCSTGEEAYSIAILFCEVMDTLKVKRAVKIFATDLDAESITFAGKGVYAESIIDAVSPARLSRYFTRHNSTYVVNRDVRKMIVFAPHNVFQDPPFGRLDLISCRNMLIYFQPVLQNDLFAIFHSALRDGGYLFLGKSEAIGAYTEAFPVVDAAAKIFCHNSEAKIAGAKTVPYLQTTFYDEGYATDADIEYIRQAVPREARTNEQVFIDTTLLERFMPACLVVDDKNELVHTFGENSNYIHFSTGKVSTGLYDVITESLKVPVSTLLKEAREQQKLVQYKEIHFAGEHANAIVNLTAMPIKGRVNASENYYALVFSETTARGVAADAIPYEIDKIASRRITDLEQDLSEAQEKLGRSVAEQECVNEELQAANEELLTANEELQSSNEELQSVNEELYTVNTEYQLKLNELAEMNDDVANFLSTTLIGIIFVDNKLNIRRYTDYVTSEFSVMDHDIGRSLKFISYHFPAIDITEICDNVLKTLVPDEREVVTSKGKAFLMRVSPYRTTENKILGCVISLVDISTQKQGQVMLQSTEEQLAVMQKVSDNKSDYISQLAHEIRTPMSSLVGLAEIAHDQIDDKAALGESLDTLVDTVNYMTSIIADISSMAQAGHLEEGEEALESFVLHDAISSVVSIIKPSAVECGLSFEVSLFDDCACCYLGNETRIQQILINFLMNAVKYTPRGGRVSLEVFEDSSAEGDSPLCFVISDTGIGISSEFLPKVFQPSSREGDSAGEDAGAEGGDDSRSAIEGEAGSAKADDIRASGLGLGLSIADNLIRSMQGYVEVESEVGKGSTFTIRIPLKRVTSRDDSASQKASATAPHVRQLAGYRALIAEDNELNRAILSALLSRENMDFTEVGDGEEAVETFIDAPEHSFDCILMDMKMPTMDGITATSLIRDSEKADAKTIPIIGVSANGFSDDIDKAYKAGIDSYITKPIDADSLFDEIERLMTRE